LIWPKAMAFADNQKMHVRAGLKQWRQIILSNFPFSSFLPALCRNELRKKEICRLLSPPTIQGFLFSIDVMMTSCTEVSE
jgi:hypothetical protein